MRVAVLGGTGEARELVERLRVLPEVTFDVSLARDGGFGGVDGLADYLASGRYDALIDATHPFATVITSHAIAAALVAGVPLAVLRRPAWTAQPGDDWRVVPTFAAAAGALADYESGSVFLAIGRKELGWFTDIDRHHFVLRFIEAPGAKVALPPRHTLLLERGPFELIGERALLTSHGIGVVVTKDSGGAGAIAKLTAARELGRPVIMIARPSAPPIPTGVRIVDSVPAALGWLFSSSR